MLLEVHQRECGHNKNLSCIFTQQIVEKQEGSNTAGKAREDQPHALKGRI